MSEIIDFKSENQDLITAMQAYYQEWLDAIAKMVRYCHYFTVSIADDTSPIGYHPSQNSEFFYLIEDAVEHREALKKQNPSIGYLITSGSIHVQVLEKINNKWSALHKARIARLQECEA